MSDTLQDSHRADTVKFESMNFGMVLDRAIQLYVKNFLLVLGITAVPDLLIYIGFAFSGVLIQEFAAVGSLLILAALGIHFLLYGLSGGAVTIAVSKRYLGERITVGKAYRAAFKKLGSILRARFTAGILIFLGFLLLIVPGIMLAISFCLITPVIMLEGLPAVESRDRSRTLVKGFRWQTLGLFLIYYAISQAVTYAVGFFTRSLVGSFQAPANIYFYVYHFINAAVVILHSPFRAILFVLIYYNQRIRKEGFDLAMLAEALAKK